MSKWNELKALAGDEALSERPSRHISCEEYRRAFELFLEEAQPAAILGLIEEVEALREKVSELNFDAARYCYLATTTWSDEVTDALCTSDKDQIDQAIDAELMRASA